MVSEPRLRRPRTHRAEARRPHPSRTGRTTLLGWLVLVVLGAGLLAGCGGSDEVTLPSTWPESVAVPADGLQEVVTEDSGAIRGTWVVDGPPEQVITDLRAKGNEQGYSQIGSPDDAGTFAFMANNDQAYVISAQAAGDDRSSVTISVLLGAPTS